MSPATPTLPDDTPCVLCGGLYVQHDAVVLRRKECGGEMVCFDGCVVPPEGGCAGVIMPSFPCYDWPAGCKWNWAFVNLGDGSHSCGYREITYATGYVCPCGHFHLGGHIAAEGYCTDFDYIDAGDAGCQCPEPIVHTFSFCADPHPDYPLGSVMGIICTCAC